MSGERREKQREDGRTRVANTRESFPLLHMAVFHTSHARVFRRAHCPNLPLLNFLFSSLPPTNKAIFRFSVTNNIYS